jgi:hypothetical protein
VYLNNRQLFIPLLRLHFKRRFTDIFASQNGPFAGNNIIMDAGVKDYLRRMGHAGHGGGFLYG